MAHYLLSVWHDDDYELDFSSEEAQRQVARVGRFNADLETAGAWVFAGGLQPASSASVIRADGADVSMTDGPYAHESPQMGGFWIIDADERDGAVAWARRAAEACECPVEVRPLQGA
jgi:hypothetical protein